MTEIALIGNPNCGKTTLFNALTGSYQKTGNWTGVTTEQKTGQYKKNKSIKIVDLPGLYSLDTNSEDERVVLKYLKENKPKALINIVDGTNLERNLYLTCELASLGIPTVVAINMYDELLKNKVEISLKGLEDLFGVPVVAISALKGTNIDKLISFATNSLKRLKSPDLSPYRQNTIAERRYKFLEERVGRLISKNKNKTQVISERIDKIILNKFLKKVNVISAFSSKKVLPLNHPLKKQRLYITSTALLYLINFIFFHSRIGTFYHFRMDTEGLD